MSESVNPTPITEDWLRLAGFKWSQFDRQPNKMWLLWLGDCFRTKGWNFNSAEDLGVEVTMNTGERPYWNCWLRSDTAGRYHRFIHVRHIHFQEELIVMIEALTGQQFDPANNMYGAMRKADHAAWLKAQTERLDQRLMRGGHPWSEIEKDDSLAGAQPGHLEFHEKAKKQP